MITRGLGLRLAMLENRGFIFTSLARGSITGENLYQTDRRGSPLESVSSARRVE